MKKWSNTKLVVEPTSIEVSLATFAPISGGKFAVAISPALFYTPVPIGRGEHDLAR